MSLSPRSENAPILITHETAVLVVGAGPSGLIAALQLARKGIRCIIVERNTETTRWPKMDITNCRSMELLRRLNLADRLRDQGVPQKFSFDVLFSTGLGEGGEKISQWDLPSPDAWRDRIRKQNDGSMPHQPYQRCSQAIFEAWLKPIIQAEPLIESYFGLKFEYLIERHTEVESRLIDIKTGQPHSITSQYVIGCDGAGSRVRRSIGGRLIGGPVPSAMFLVHFKSRDLKRLWNQGQFWHIFFTSGSVIISQDEVDTWTAHMPVALDVDITTIDPVQTVYQVLGGSGEPFEIKIDKVLVTSCWRPNIVIADRYQTKLGRVFLAGDSAHQNIPTGGYGMNTGLADSFDIAWKIAAVLNGYGGKFLLQSYEEERRPVAVRNIERSGVHRSRHNDYVDWVDKAGKEVATSQSVDGEKLRDRIRAHMSEHDGENKDHGIEMGYRNVSSVVVADEDAEEPEWNYRDYIPSTWPGARAPQVLLADGKTSVFDAFGPDYTLVDFSPQGLFASEFAEAAQVHKIPLKTLHLPNEHHVRNIWGTESALIRPDDHIAWRASNSKVDANTVLLIAVGKIAYVPQKYREIKAPDVLSKIKETGFSATIGNVDQAKVERLAVFQQ